MQKNRIRADRGVVTVVTVVTAAVLALFGCRDDVGDFPMASSGEGPIGGDASLDGPRHPESKDGSIDHDDSTDGAPDASYDTDSGAAVYRTLLASLGTRSETCRACAEESCPSAIRSCGTLSGSAQTGPARGTSNAALCVETVDCVTKHACSQRKALDCYCGSQILENCLSSDTGDGVCKTTLERSLQTVVPQDIPLRLDALSLDAGAVDGPLAGGWGLSVVQCLRDHYCTSCFQLGASDASVEGSK